MRPDRGNPQRFRQLAPLLLTILVAIAVWPGSPSYAASASPAPPEPLRAGDLVQPKELARMLALPAARRPELLQVGFKVLYRSGHITGSRYAGPASRPDGLEALRQALQPLPRQRSLVLYCGCCPWSDCPNVHPAFRLARTMGFNDVHVLYIARNLQHDWIDQGLPFSQGD